MQINLHPVWIRLAKQCPRQSSLPFEDAQHSLPGNDFDWWGALGVQVLTFIARLQQVPYASRRCRAVMIAVLDAWYLLSGSEIAIVEEFCRHILHGIEAHPSLQEDLQVQASSASAVLDQLPRPAAAPMIGAWKKK